jgi:hypothetical protein
VVVEVVLVLQHLLEQMVDQELLYLSMPLANFQEQQLQVHQQNQTMEQLND